jgi:cobalt/nickel transport system permease protein
VDQWSRGDSYLHGRDPRAKICTLLIFLIVLATTPYGRWFGLQMFTYAAILLIGIAAAHLPAGALEIRALVVLPFCAVFALISWLSGDPSRAVMLLVKTYLSALAVLLLVTTTPLQLLLRGLESLGAPRMFVLVLQFLHRYLFLISEQAHHMRLAAACRQGRSRQGRADQIRAAAGAVSVLYGRSYSRAFGIHQAMLSRGFQGRFAAGARLHFHASDAAFLAIFAIALSAVRLAFSPQ